MLFIISLYVIDKEKRQYCSISIELVIISPLIPFMKKKKPFRNVNL